MYSFGFGVPNKPVSASAPAFGVNGFQISPTNFQWTHTPVANPTTRPDGSSLISGDRIYDSTNGEQWWWNGSLWLSNEFQSQSWGNNFANGSTLNTIIDTSSGRDVFLKEVVYSFNAGGTTTTSGTNTLTTTIRTLGPSSSIVVNTPLPNGISVISGVRVSIKQSLGTTISVKPLGATSAGLFLSVINGLGFIITAFNFGLRWYTIR